MPSILYVKNFIVNSVSRVPDRAPTSRSTENGSPEVGKSDLQEVREFRLLQIRKTDFLKYEIRTLIILI